MHTLLERYLLDIAAHLSTLPVKRRTEELREMRQHLLNAVTVNQELGQSEEDAAQSAVQQFGTPEDLGDNLVWVWRRGRVLDRKILLGAIATTIVLLNSLPYLTMLLMCNLVVPFASWLRVTHQWPHLAIQVLCFLTVDAPTWWLIGAATARCFPKKAAIGTGCIMAAWVTLQAAQHVWFELIEIPDLMTHGYFHRRSDYRSVEEMMTQFCFDILLALVAVRAAQAGSQRHNAQGKRSRLVQD